LSLSGSSDEQGENYNAARPINQDFSPIPRRVPALQPDTLNYPA
jgi:hypothetical protein